MRIPDYVAKFEGLEPGTQLTEEKLSLAGTYIALGVEARMAVFVVLHGVPQGLCSRAVDSSPGLPLAVRTHVQTTSTMLSRVTGCAAGRTWTLAPHSCGSGCSQNGCVRSRLRVQAAL